MMEALTAWTSTSVGADIVIGLRWIMEGFLGLFVFWFTFGMIAACVMATLEERKLWKEASLPSLSLWGLWKVFLWNILCTVGYFIMAVLLIAKKIVTFGQSDLAYDAHVIGERSITGLCVWATVGKIRIVGEENLPPADNTGIIPAPVFVANHASQIDTGVVFQLNRRFKWVAKSTISIVPGVGQLMGLAQHVFVNRSKAGAKSKSDLFDQANRAIQTSIPMFFFPQGTRCMTERKPFKHGAFTVAIQNHSRIIPISIDIPPNAWNSAYPFTSDANTPVITLTVHAPIKTNHIDLKKVEQDTDYRKHCTDELMQQCSDIIYTAVPNILAAENKAKAAAAGETTPLLIV